jgi:hypothetical protein
MHFVLDKAEAEILPLRLSSFYAPLLKCVLKAEGEMYDLAKS